LEGRGGEVRFEVFGSIFEKGRGANFIALPKVSLV